MLLAKLITPKKTNALRKIFRFTFNVIFIAFCSPVFAQDNSPYSRYGLGDLVPTTNINTRAMGGISTGYNEFFSVNFSNPASYGSFYAIREAKSKKILYGRAVLDIGLNIENRTLIAPNTVGKFTANNALFSHVQVGVPLRSGWGLSFGLRPMSRISYKINQGGQVLSATPPFLPTGDSTITLSAGDGGSYLASVGTGFRVKDFSFGVNGGYLFGKKDYSSRKTILNDSVAYNSGNFQTKTTYGGLYLNAGMQYMMKLDSTTYMTFGAYGNLKQKLNASQDLIRETYFFDPSSGNVRIDSVYEKNDVKGKIEYPSSFTAGVTIQRIPVNKKGGWLLGIDFSRSNWKSYRIYGQADSLRNTWKLNIGGELRPSLDAARKSYFGNVAYRAGFFIGPDYVQVKGKLPVFGITLGAGLPLRNFNRLNNQVTLINIAFEYIKRGNNDNLLKENLFRFSMGFCLSDLWFAKKKYE
jgi:hypothetical protein